MSLFITSLLLIVFVFFNNSLAYANSENDFDWYMNQWDVNKELASQYLLEAEKAFKEGDELTACATQKEASEYGIQATSSLIKAMELNGTMDSMENLLAGLNKWKEIGEICGSILN